MQRFGQYQIQSLIGSGGMGEVYLAHDTRRDREVALKLLPKALSNDPEYQRRFQRESYAAARLREPHVIPIHDYGETDGRLFIDMRLVDGPSLGALIERGGPLSPERAVGLVSQIAEALDAAHPTAWCTATSSPQRPRHRQRLRLRRRFRHRARRGPHPVEATITAPSAPSTTWRPSASRATGRPPHRRLLAGVRALRVPHRREAVPRRRLPAWCTRTSTPAAAGERGQPGLGTDDAVVAKGMAKNPADRYPSTGDSRAPPGPPCACAEPARGSPGCSPRRRPPPRRLACRRRTRPSAPRRCPRAPAARHPSPPPPGRAADRVDTPRPRAPPHRPAARPVRPRPPAARTAAGAGRGGHRRGRRPSRPC